MKKKILLIIMMFMFITNVNALTFNVDITNIEDEGNNGTIGSIEKIDLENKELDVLFQDIGDEVSFSITVTNTGDRAGTLRNITFESGNDKIEYTSNLPEGGLAINGNDTNKVTINAKVKAGAVNGKTSSEVKIKYTYDEGSCPDGEILSEDESLCLCPEGLERNEEGICVKPDTPVVCEDDEIYNSEKKICEKKVVPPTPKPINPSNPKTLDNIILITLLFFVSGLGIYAVMFKKLNTNKKKVTVGVITGVITLTLSFTVLASVFGIDNLLSAIVNPITKSKELLVTVNEEIDLIETWDGDCDVTGALTPDNVFNGGSGTESDPYQIKTANQLACFAKSVNEGETYEGKFIKQTKNIKLNDNLNDRATSGDLSNANLWTSAGVYASDSQLYFAGTYDGDNHIISGLYLTDISNPDSNHDGFFGCTNGATLKNMILSDVYMNETDDCMASLIGHAKNSLILNNITTYGKADFASSWTAGIVSQFYGSGDSNAFLKIENTTNNISFNNERASSGVIHEILGIPTSEEPNLIIKNVTNNGNLSLRAGASGGVIGKIDTSANVSIDNVVNNGNILSGTASMHGGIVGSLYCTNASITNSHNIGNWSNAAVDSSGGIVGYADCKITFNNVYNSGNIIDETYEVFEGAYTGGSSHLDIGGIIGYNDDVTNITNSYNTGKIVGLFGYLGGIAGRIQPDNAGTIEDSYNLGDLKGYGYTGGIVGAYNGTLNKVYNKGNIHVFGGPRAGGLSGWGGSSWRGINIYNSYNEGDILISSRSGQHGGLCANDCGEIKNSYNRGNITSERYGADIGGITGQSGTISNVYNSGTITFLNIEDPFTTIGGISGASSVTNSYNLGDIIVHQNGYAPRTFDVGGIAGTNSATNSVNAGNITLKINQTYGSAITGFVSGISSVYNATNCFNAGNITLDYAEGVTPMSEDGLAHDLRIGQISEYSGSNNKFNTDPDGFATGCLTGKRPSENCTIEHSLTVGTYTTEETPDILSIINGDDAFEIKEGETLPTLKVFNN